MALALMGRSARSTEIRCLKTAAVSALVLTDACEGFRSWCFLPGPQGSSLLIWIKSNQHLGLRGVPSQGICVYGAQRKSKPHWRHVWLHTTGSAFPQGTVESPPHNVLHCRKGLSTLPCPHLLEGLRSVLLP